MRLHELNVLSMCPRTGRWFSKSSLVTRCVVIETDSGLIAIDVGISRRDFAEVGRLGGSFHRWLDPQPASQTLAEQLLGLGYSTNDVQAVFLTHLDADHAAGLVDFPRAQVHVMSAEKARALAQGSLVDRSRYRPCAWQHEPQWVLHSSQSAPAWHGFDDVTIVETLGVAVHMVPLGGHSIGHCGIAIPTGGERWLLHAGDAYFARAEIADTSWDKSSRALHLYGGVLAANRRLWRDNQRRLQALARDANVTVVSSHDPAESLLPAMAGFCRPASS